jgi:heme oxygenase (biliverdin-IX-beta and delta-forming)
MLKVAMRMFGSLGGSGRPCKEAQMTGEPTSPIRETDAGAIRLGKRLLREARYAALSALEPGTGAPLVSRVAVATAPDGAPLILVSRLSAHTGAIEADARCALLLGEPGRGDPLAHPRLSLAAGARRLPAGSPEAAQAAARYLARHPGAALYAGFADFGYFRLEPLRASLNGGFGKAYLLTREDLVTASPGLAALAEIEAGAVAHMNADHAGALAAIAAAAGAGAGRWQMTGLDPEGIDLTDGDRALRVWFGAPLVEAADLRPVLAGMARKARAER